MKKQNNFKRKHTTISLWLVLSSLQERKLKKIAKEQRIYGKKAVIKYLIDKA